MVVLPLFWENYITLQVDLKIRWRFQNETTSFKTDFGYYPKIKPKSIFYATTNLSTPGFLGRFRWGIQLCIHIKVIIREESSNKLWPITEGYEEHGEYGFGLYFDFLI
jgi:hypothetical protein